MNLNLAARRARRVARNAYYAIEENLDTDTSRDTLRRSSDPAERAAALDQLAGRETSLYWLHDGAFGRTPWDDDTAGDAATGLAYGAMVLTLLRAAETARANGDDDWPAHWNPLTRTGATLAGTELCLRDACAPHLCRIATENDPEEVAVLYTRLWIAAYPIIGGQAAEWIAVLGNDWKCMAAGVQDGPRTVLTLPNDRRGDVQYLTATD